MYPGIGTTEINSCVSFLQREVGGWPWAGHLHCNAHVGHLRISQLLTHGSECARDCASRKAPWLMATPGLSGTRRSERSGINLIKILPVPTLRMAQFHEFTYIYIHTHTLYRILDDRINETKCCITRNDKWLLDREAAWWKLYLHFFEISTGNV